MLVTENLNCKYLEWDSQQLNIDCGLIDAANFKDIEGSRLSAEIISLLEENTDMDFITIKTGPHQLDTVGELVKFGADLIDTELVFKFKEKTSCKVCPAEYEFTFCGKTDFMPFISLADQMVKSHFFLDRQIPEAECRE